MPYLKKAQKKTLRKINREDRQKMYQSSEWQKLRKAKLQKNPLCELCLQECKIKAATQVHHIISPFIKKDWAYYAYNWNNLLSLCEQCHGTIHGLHKESSLYGIFYSKESNSDTLQKCI